jgi:hypothetical protein
MMNKPRKYYSSLIQRLKQEIPREISEQNDSQMGLAVEITETLRTEGILQDLQE